MRTSGLIIAVLLVMESCSSGIKEDGAVKATVKLITLDPGHFHAALVQKTMYGQMDTNVYVYAPAGDDLIEHLRRVDGYNMRPDNPTRWNEIVYQGPGYLENMLMDRPGNVVVLAGNNRQKIGYIMACVKAGFNVLADKPMVINMAGFEMLRESFEIAGDKGVLLYDIMTERSEITTILQKEFSLDTTVFGTLVKGTPQLPAVTKESVHHFFKFVSGSALKRPAWFFDVNQQGEGIVDVTTHLVDLIQWECFPEQVIDYQKDIEVVDARRWPTCLMPEEFKEVTKLNGYPGFLKKDVKDSMLHVFANGEIHYKIKGTHAKVSVIWNYQAPEGGGDSHYSIMRGTKASLVIRQGKEQNYKPALFIEPVAGTVDSEYVELLSESIGRIQTHYPGVRIKREKSGWAVIIPDKYRISHEDHFTQVTERYLQYLKDGKLPDWEVPNMLARYYTLVKALEIARQKE